MSSCNGFHNPNENSQLHNTTKDNKHKINSAIHLSRSLILQQQSTTTSTNIPHCNSNSFSVIMAMKIVAKIQSKPCQNTTILTKIWNGDLHSSQNHFKHCGNKNHCQNSVKASPKHHHFDTHPAFCFSPMGLLALQQQPLVSDKQTLHRWHFLSSCPPHFLLIPCGASSSSSHAILTQNDISHSHV